MSESLQPVAGSLSVKVIRACRKHDNACSLDCPERVVEDHGVVASFHTEPAQSILERLKEGLSKWSQSSRT